MVMRQKVFESNNKGLFDIAVGEGNISPDFATELQNARVALNGEVSKRRGRNFFNSKPVAWAAGSSVDTYAVGNKDSQISVYSANNEQTGFAFTLASDDSLQYIQFYLDKVGSPTGACRAKIYAATGTPGTDGLPTGSVLATSNDVAVPGLTGTFTLTDFTFEDPYSATAGNFVILLEYNGGDSSNYIRIGVDSSAPGDTNANVLTTDTKGSSWAADATKDIIFDLFKAGPEIISLMLFEGDFVDDYEVLAQADTRVMRYTPSTGAFDVEVKAGLTANKRLSWTMFNGRIVMSNGTDNMFKYGYLQQGLNPTTGTVVSGSKLARTYYVALTYKSANGETIASEETTKAIGINYVAQPAIPTTGVATDGSKLSRTYYVSTTYITANGESTPTAFGATGTSILTGDAVTSVTVVTGGTGYSTAPIVTFSGGGGSSAAGTAVLTGGVVTSVTIGSGGSGYTSEPTVAFSGGEKSQAIGANDVLTVTSPSASDGATGYNVYHHTASGDLKLQNVSPIAIGTDYTETTGSLNDGAAPPSANTGWYGHVLTVTSPISIIGATHYNVYHHTVSGSLKLQNTSPITLGTDYTEDSGALNDGAAPPTSNDAWYAVDLLDNPPKAKYVFALNSRVWASGITNNNTRFRGSAVATDDDWTTSSDAVDIDLAGSLARGDQITGLNRLGQTGKLILGLKNHIVTYSVPAVFNDIAIDKIVYNSGVMSHAAMDEVGIDNYIVETAGLNSLKNEIIVQGLKTKKLSDNIKDRLVPLLEGVVDPDEVHVINHKPENEFIISIPSLSRRYIFNYSIKAWMEDRDVKAYGMVSTPNSELLSAGGNGRVYREYKDANGSDVWADGNNNKPISFQWDTPWLWMDSIQVKKMFKYFRFKGSGAAGLFDMKTYFDFSDEEYKTFYLQSKASYYSSVDWDAAYWDFPDINKVLVPMIGMGKAIRFSFISNHKTDMKIAFYGVSFVPSGIRAND